jgi:hypothetical protein
MGPDGADVARHGDQHRRSVQVARLRFALVGDTEPDRTAGLEREDLGLQTVEVTAGIAGSRMRAMQERFQQKMGVAVYDWRHIVRGANIDVSDLFGMSGADLIACMTNMIELLPSRVGRPVFYMNRTLRRALRNPVRDAVSGGGGLTFENYAGRKTMFFDEIPVKTCDALLNTEDEVV